MHITLTGGSGFVGQAITAALIEKEHQVTVIARSSPKHAPSTGNLDHISADTTREGPWQESVAQSDGVINLTGLNIFRYWTPENKKNIYHSRILTTRNIVDAIEGDRKTILLNASAAGYYGDGEEDVLTEDAPPGNDFLAKVCVDWEREALQAASKNTRVVAMRFGVVLGKNGGALSKMAIPFKLFLGGPIGSGRQWFPWIHMDDLVGAALLALEDDRVEGPVNFTAPGQVRQKEFAQALGKALNRPAVMPFPSFAVRLLMGELGKAFLSSQRAVPKKLEGHDFTFSFPDLASALKQC